MRDVLESIETEYRLYKGLAEATFEQLTPDQLGQVLAADGNSIVILVWHISGNLKSRFTDFLTSDGEKPWRQRESEFDAREPTHADLRRKWDEGWAVLLATLRQLSDADLSTRVVIRGEGMSVGAALHRSLAHTIYHVGQIVLLGKSLRGAAWRTLSVPRNRART